MTKILVLHGVNLNMLGKRDPKQYGTNTLLEANQEIEVLADSLNVEVETFQTNHEGEMVEKIHGAYKEGIDGVVINAGAWTHYSYAIRDALEMLDVPFIEVHMSNVHAREDFRKHSVLSDIAAGVVAGLGVESYLLSVQALVKIIQS